MEYTSLACEPQMNLLRQLLLVGYSKHQKSLDDYKLLMESGSVESSIQYNRLLCEGVLKI